uniref:Methyltransferase domain-containing protein n=1 Tax=Panagrolaimus sp. ES5 TaxID=591445 RepID=A0AC34FRP8_9BILA
MKRCTKPLAPLVPPTPLIFSPIKNYPASDEIDQNVLNLYRQQIHERQQYLQNVPESSDYFLLYNILVPEVFCRDLVRIGFIGDGGKWICNPSSVQSLPECVVYSLGIHNEPTFEESFQNLTNLKCMLRSLDKDEQNETTMNRISVVDGTFMKATIAGKRNESMNHYTLKDVMETFNDKRVDILKIDIEGAEFDIQEELISVPMCQLLIEIHGNSARHTLQLLHKLSKNGFFLFSYEINGRYHE